MLEILKTFNIFEGKPADTPMAPFDGVYCEMTGWNQCFTYKQVIGALLYLANNIRPDIVFAYNYLAQYQEEPQKENWRNKLQQCTAESSGEADYIAVCNATRSALFHARLSEEVSEL